LNIGSYFTPSDECVNIKFVNQGEIQDMSVFPSIKQLARMFDPLNHFKQS